MFLICSIFDSKISMEVHMLDSSPATDNSQALQTNDYHQLCVTEKQLKFARFLAQKNGVVLPWDVQQDRSSLSRWIDAQNTKDDASGRFDSYASSRQVQFAERIARYKKRQVPDECFRDKHLMSKWIDCNK